MLSLVLKEFHNTDALYMNLLDGVGVKSSVSLRLDNSNCEYSEIESLNFSILSSSTTQR